jgi:hypothetical protein
MYGTYTLSPLQMIGKWGYLDVYKHKYNTSLVKEGVSISYLKETISADFEFFRNPICSILFCLHTFS